MNTARRTTILALCSLMLALALAAPASAHDELVKAVPADGTTLKKLPSSGRLTFAEETAPGDLQVWAGRRRLAVTAVPGDAHTLSYSLANVTRQRTIVVTWSVVDEHDGHRSGGSLRLYLDGAKAKKDAEDIVATGASEPRARHWLDVGSHAVGFLAMVILVGGLLFLALIWPAGARDRRARRLLVGSVVAGLAGAIGAGAVVLWRGSDQSVSTVLATDYGRAASAAVLIWLLAAIVVAGILQLDAAAVGGIAWRLGAVVVSAGLIRITGLNAHATQGQHRTLGIVADFLHLTAISAWAGGLVMLSACLVPRGRPDELQQAVPRFSKVAFGSVLAIVSSGLLLIWDISRGIDGFWTTHYAHVLIVKLALFSLVMLAAMKSRRWVLTALEDAVSAHRRTAIRSFAVSVATETVLVIAVLAAASVLVTSSPGR